MTTMPSPSKMPYRGFIALTSAIIIAAVLLGITTTLSMSGYFARGDSLTSEFKRVSLGLAESCANVALLRFSQNYAYAGNETIAIGTDAQGIAESCKVLPVTIQSSTATQKTVAISVQGIYRNTYSDLTITSTIQNPASQVVNTLLTVTTILPSGATPSQFPISISPSVGSAITSGTSFQITPNQTYTVSVPGTPPTGYTTDFHWLGDCDLNGVITAALGTSNSCAIYYTAQPTTAALTIIVSVIGGTNVAADFKPTIGPTALTQSSVTSGAQQQLAPGSYTLGYTNVTGYTTAGWDCAPSGTISLTKGQTQVCVITFQQPALACADTVMMLDRSYSMFGWPNYPTGYQQWIPDEEAAANGLLTEYKKASPYPKVGIGHFGNINAVSGRVAGTSAEIVAHLTSTYTNLASAISNMPSNPISYTNLGDAIFYGNQELQSVNDGLKKVLILVSDGGPNCDQNHSCDPGGNTTTAASNWATSAANTAKGAPSNTQIFTIHFGDTSGQSFLASLANNSALDHFISTDTGLLAPSATAADGSTPWATPTNAYSSSDGGASATDAGGFKQRYYNFNIPSLTGHAISGIELDAVAGVLSTSADSPSLVPSAPGNYDTTSWQPSSGTNNSTNRLAAVAANNGTYLTSSTNGSVYTVRVANAGLPATAVVNSVTLYADLASSNFSAVNVKLRAEKGTGGGQQSDDGGHSASGTGGTTVSRQMTTNPFTGSAWAVSEVNNWTTRFGVVRNNNGSQQPRVDQLYVVVNYSVPANPACKLGVEISPDAGATWIAAAPTTLTGTLTNYVYGGATNLWGQSSWSAADFTNANFRVRVQDIDPDPASNTLCTNGAPVSLDSLRARVYYAGSIADAAAENADGDNFFIAPQSSDMAAVFKTIANTVCPATVAASSGHLYVLTNVINSDGGTKQAADFQVTVTGGGATPASFPGSSTGQNVSVTPGSSYSVTQSTQTGYYAPYYSQGCSGTLAAGETKTCVIISDDTPPPPPPPPIPPPPSNINIGSWLQNP